DKYVDLVLRIRDAYLSGDYSSVPNNTTSAISFTPDYTLASPNLGSQVATNPPKANNPADPSRPDSPVAPTNPDNTPGTGDDGGGDEPTGPTTPSLPDSPLKDVTKPLKDVTKPLV